MLIHVGEGGGKANSWDLNREVKGEGAAVPRDRLANPRNQLAVGETWESVKTSASEIGPDLSAFRSRI